MLSGLMSRWMIARPWAYARASATSRRTRRVKSSGARPSRLMYAPRLSPSTSAMTKNESINLIDAVDRNDVRMAQLSRSLRFAKKARPHLLSKRELGRQQLDSHGAAQADIARTIDDTHAACPSSSETSYRAPTAAERRARSSSGMAVIEDGMRGRSRQPHDVRRFTTPESRIQASASPRQRNRVVDFLRQRHRTLGELRDRWKLWPPVFSFSTS